MYWRRSTAELVQLGGRQHGRGVDAALDGDKRSCDRGVELRPGVALDLRQGCLVREPRAVGAVRRHRVEAVGDDQEVRREREIFAADAVVARAVHALVMKLDRARLRRHELEPLQQSSGKAGMAAHRGPLGAVQGSLLAQERSVDRHLAEIVQATRPAQPVDLGVGQLQGARQTVDVTGDAERVTVGRWVALVDDVGKRLERAKRLPLEALQSMLHLLHRNRDRDEQDDVPGMANREQSERRSEAHFAGARDESRVEGLVTADDVEEERADGEVGEAERDDGNEVVQQTQTAGLAAGEAEREPACAGGDRRGARIEDHGPHGKAPKESNRDDAGGCDECARPGPEDDQSTDLDRGGKPEALPLHRLARALAVRLLEQLHEDDRRQEEGERRVGDVGQLGERDREHGQAEPDRGQE